MGKDAELSNGNYTTHFRALDTRIGRWLSDDPVTHHSMSPYNSMDNNPIAGTDIAGSNTESTHLDAEGNIIATYDDGDDQVYQHNDISGLGNHIDGLRAQVNQKRDFYRNTSGNGVVSSINLSTKPANSKSSDNLVDDVTPEGEHWLYGDRWDITAIPKENAMMSGLDGGFHVGLSRDQDVALNLFLQFKYGGGKELVWGEESTPLQNLSDNSRVKSFQLNLAQQLMGGWSEGDLGNLPNPPNLTSYGLFEGIYATTLIGGVQEYKVQITNITAETISFRVQLIDRFGAGTEDSVGKKFYLPGLRAMWKLQHHNTYRHGHYTPFNNIFQLPTFEQR